MPKSNKYGSLINIDFLPKPTYLFNIGDKVRVGALYNPTVKEIYEEGRVYLIEYDEMKSDYSTGKCTKIFSHKSTNYFEWMWVRKITNNKESFINNEDLFLNYQQRDINGLIGICYHFGLNDEPEYQRGHVWDEEDKIKLLDSIFHCVDIGKFVLVRKNYNDKYLYEVLDGKQRIKAIRDYYEDKFLYKGKSFSDLSIRDQYHFSGYPISYAEISNATKEQVYRYFVMLNTGGRIMPQSQINEVNKLIEELRK